MKVFIVKITFWQKKMSIFSHFFIPFPLLHYYCLTAQCKQYKKKILLAFYHDDEIRIRVHISMYMFLWETECDKYNYKEKIYKYITGHLLQH